jgi:tape measure domain-containing protein
MVVQELLTRLGFTVDKTGLQQGQDALSGFKSFIGKLALGAGVAMVGKMAIQSAAQMESINAQFTTMLGSQEKAAAFMSKINKFAAETPFETGDIAQAAQTLMGFGVKAEDVMGTVSMLGDVAGSNAQKFGSLALVFGQIQSTGRLMGGDLLQLINAGFNPLKVISEKTGRSIGQLKEDMEKGRISADMVTAAFQVATSKGGLFYGNLKNQSQTFQVVWSTMMDNLRMSLTKMVQPLMPTIKKIIEALGKVDFSPIVKQFEALAGNAGDITPVIVSVANSLVELVAELMKVLPAITAFVTTSAVLLVPIVKLLGLLVQIPGVAELAGVSLIAMFAKSSFAMLGFSRNLIGLPGMLGKVAASTTAVGTASTAAAAEATAMTTAMNTMGGAGVLGGLEKVRGALNGLSLAAKGTIVLLAAVALWEAKKAVDGVIEERKEAKKIKDQMRDQNNYAKVQQRLATQLNEAKEAGDLEEAKRLQHKLDENRRIWAGQTKAEYYGARGLDEFGNKLQEQTQGAVDASSKIMNVFNSLTMDIKAPGGKDSKTGLTAGQIVELANQAVKASFNVQLKKVLVGAT